MQSEKTDPQVVGFVFAFLEFFLPGINTNKEI